MVLGHLLGLGQRLVPFALALAALVIGAGLVLGLVRLANTRRVASGGHLLEVLCPPSVEPEGAVMLWSHLVSLLRPAWRRHLGTQHHLAFELRGDRAGLHIDLFVPDAVPVGLVDNAIRSAWPGALTTLRPARPPLALAAVGEDAMPKDQRGSRRSRRHTGRLATGGELGLSRAECYPLRFEHKVDPLRPLLGILANLHEDDEACVQILARPVTGRRLAAMQRAAEARRAGLAIAGSARLLGALAAPIGHGGRGVPAERDPRRSRDLSAILDKAASPCWAIKLRYVVATDFVATDVVGTDVHGGIAVANRAAQARLRGSAHGLASAFAVFAGDNSLRRRHLRRPLAVLARRQLGRGDLVSAGELAALAHLPSDIGIAGLARAGARAVAPPPAVAGLGAGAPEAGGLRAGVLRAGGLRAGGQGSGVEPGGLGQAGSGPGDIVAGGAVASGVATKRLGRSDTGARRPVGLSVPDARYHCHVLGATGSGKSTLLSNLILGDVAAGRGVVVIDPKGDLVTDILARLPASVGSRTVLIDPADRLDPPVLNPLGGSPDEADLVVDNLVGIFRRIFEAFWGPRTDDVLRSACLTLLRHAGRTSSTPSLSDVVRLLSEESFRRDHTAGLDRKDGLVGFWDWYEQMGEAQRAQVIGPVMNKLRAFLLRDFARDLVSGAPSSFSMDEVLDGGLCLVRIPKGTLGEETSRLIGSFVVAKIWQAATHRSGLAERDRRDATCYVDECQNFLNLPRSFDEMLAEARGYRLSLVLAHQHLGQLPRELKEAVSANARNKVFFSVSPEDAHVLARHVAPELSEHDLSHLGAYQVAARLLVGGAEQPAFTLRSDGPAPLLGEEEKLRTAARGAYGRRAVEARRRAPSPEMAPSRRPQHQDGEPIAPVDLARDAGFASKIAAGTETEALRPRTVAQHPGTSWPDRRAPRGSSQAAGVASVVASVVPGLASQLASSGELRSDDRSRHLQGGQGPVGGSHGSPDSSALSLNQQGAPVLRQPGARQQRDDAAQGHDLSLDSEEEW